MWRKAVIDLTPLLDVILILLFLILASVSTQAEQMAGDAAKAQRQIDTLQAEKDALQRTVEGFAILDQKAQLINVFLEKGSSNVSRTIHVETAAGTSTFLLTWSNGGVVQTALEEKLSALCNGNSEAEKQISFITFRYDRNSIYQSDYTMISNAITSVKIHANDIYSAEYDIGEDHSIEDPS